MSMDYSNSEESMNCLTQHLYGHINCTELCQTSIVSVVKLSSATNKIQILKIHWGILEQNSIPTSHHIN